MIQKILVILVGLVMSLVGALAPSAQFAARDAGHSLGSVADVANAEDTTLASVRTSDNSAFARIPVLWVELEGKRATEDAWGTGEIRELRFKVGVKDVEGLTLAVGDKVVPLHPTDVLTIRTFRGDFAYRDVNNANAGLQLQGTVKTTSLHAGAPVGKLTTSGLAAPVKDAARSSDAGRIAFVTLNTGEDVDTVSVSAGGARIVTEEDSPQGTADLGNLLVKWVKVDGKPIREYTWGTGAVDRLEFEPATGEGASVMLKFRDAAADAAPGAHVLVKDFVGEYLVYQVSDQLLRIRLDGYAGDLTTGVGLAGSKGPAAGGAAPIAQFETTPQILHTTDVLTLKDRSTDDGIIVFWKWQFGDGLTSIVQDPTHRFTKPGSYEITLTVTDDDLNTATATRTIVVNNADPLPDFEFQPTVVTTATLVGFTDHSLDPDGLVASWSWDFGDGTTSTMRHPSHRFETSGERTVRLTITDDLGGRATLAKRLLVHNAPPTASFKTNADQPTSRDVIQFTSTSVDKDGQIVDWSWNFGDDPKNLLGAKAHGPEVFHSFPGPGTYAVRLTVMDNAGDIGTTQANLVVLDLPPVASFVWSPTDVHTRDPVRFTSTSTDPDPNGFILLNEWDFGDGTNTSIVHAILNADASGVVGNVGNDTGSPDTAQSPVPYRPPPPVVHRFAGSGNYTVTLCVRDNLLAQDCTSQNITILNSPPVASILVVPESDGVIIRGENVTFIDKSGDPEGDPITLRQWQIGDGSPDVPNVPSLVHRFATLGNFAVNLTVGDGHGANSTAQVIVSIENAAPVASANVDLRHPGINQVVHFFGNASDRDSIGPFGYHWDFGDLNTSTDKDPVHTYTSAVPVTATLVVTDPEGKPSSQVQLRIDVGFALPVPDFTWSPITITEGQTVNFTDLSTTTNQYITGRSWSFGDGSANNVGNASNVSHVFNTCNKATNRPAPWGFNVTLKVTDTRFTSFSDPDLPSAVRTVLVNCKPTAGFAILSPLPAGQGQPITFHDTSSDPEGGVLGRHWDWGDATATDTSNDADISHAWTTPGQHTVTLTVTDDHGATSTQAKFIQIVDRAPSAGFTWSPRPAVANQPTQFTSSGLSHDPDGDGTLCEWRWDFGDGSPVLVGGTPAHADPSHVYAHSGLYLVRLVVSDCTLSSSPNAPGSLAFVRVGADHPLDIGVRGLLPYGGDQDLSIGPIDLHLLVAAEGSPKVEMTKANFHFDPIGGHFTVPAGDWGEGDTLQVMLRDSRFNVGNHAFVVSASIVLTDSDGPGSPVAMSFNIPLPLANAIDVAPGNAPSILPPALGFQSNRTIANDPIYHDASESFHGTGRVAYIDGHPADGATIDVYVRWTTELTPSLQDSLPDTTLLGWCKVATTTADLVGDYSWIAPRGGGCPLLNLPIAHYEIRTFARHMTATSSYSARHDVYADPTGILASFPLP